MWRLSLLILAPLIGMSGCGDPYGSDSDTDVADPDQAAERLFRWLQGTFDSIDQAAADPEYFSVRMVICPLDLPELGPRILYVEQATTDNLAAPYRQRLYRIEALEPESALSRVFTFGNPRAAVGLCAGEGTAPGAATVAEKEGCSVSLAWEDEQFAGGTTGQNCPSELGGAYATSEVTVQRDRVTSWDRGFEADGTQAWGIDKGPYQFLRRTPAP
jgi:hypothetical protein